MKSFDSFDMLSFLETNFSPVVHATGPEFRVNCFAPQGCGNSDNKQHLYINTETNKWYCFKCGYGSSEEYPKSNWLPTFIGDALNIPLPEVFRLYFQEDLTTTPCQSFKEALLKAFDPEEIVFEKKIISIPPYFRSLNSSSRLVPAFKKYANERGIKPYHVLKYDIRFCFAGDNFWKNRIIFPIYDREGVCRSIQGRLISESNFYSKWAIWKDSDIKYLLWPLGKFTQGQWKKIKFHQSVVITEGILDALGLIRVGYQAVCTFGKKISKEQIELLKELGVEEIVLAWDYDAKVQSKRYLNQLVNFFKVTLFPYRKKYWETHDLGDTLVLPKHEAGAMIIDELSQKIEISSYEMLTWLLD